MLSQFSHVWLWVARQAPLSMGFSRQGCWSGLHFLLQGIFPTQGSNQHLSCLLHWQAGSLPLAPSGKPLCLLFLSLFLLCRHELLVSVFKANIERYLLFQMLISICSLSWGASLSSAFFPFPDPTCQSPLRTSQKQELVSILFFCHHKANDPGDFSRFVCSFLPPQGPGTEQMHS